MRHATLTKSIVFMLVTSIVLAIAGCGDIYYDSQYSFTSPSGEKTVVVKVDYAWRPDVYYNDQRIFEFKGRGFTESVPWSVKWNSENEIELFIDGGRAKYQNERYIIAVP